MEAPSSQPAVQPAVTTPPRPWWHVRPRALLCLAVAILAAVPLWCFPYVPLQDLPTHLSTLRILHDLHNPAFGLDADYRVDLGSTQYVLFYVLGDVLAYFVSVRAAGLLLASGYMVGTVMATYSLLGALGKDQRLSLFVIPCLVNALFILGFLPFFVGLPLMLTAWTLAIRYRETGRVVFGVLLGVVMTALFYSHVVPFGVALIGIALMAPFRSRQELVRYALPLIPAGLAVVRWAFFTESGAVVRNVLASDGSDVWPLDVSLREFYSIGFDAFRDKSDERYFAIGVTLAIVGTFLGSKSKPEGTRVARWLWVVPVLCIIGYFRSGGDQGYVAHIRDRYPVLAVFTAIPLLRFPKNKWIGHGLTASLVVLAGLCVESTYWHFSKFWHEEVGDFETALKQIPPKQHVAGLIYDSSSEYIQHAPFLHYINYYQLEKGGVVSFSFSGFPHWPTKFRDHREPLGWVQAKSGSEWHSELIDVRAQLAPYFDYLIVRGSGFDPPDDLYVRAWEGTGWVVWKRRSAEPHES